MTSRQRKQGWTLFGVQLRGSWHTTVQALRLTPGQVASATAPVVSAQFELHGKPFFRGARGPRSWRE